MAEQKSRSVNDFDTADGLRDALKSNDRRQSFVDYGRDFPKALIGSSLAVVDRGERKDEIMTDSSSVVEPDGQLDWVLTNYHAEVCETQSLEEELKRLQVLKSYLILDSERESQFERLTGLAQRIFQVPICLISLVDLGRQWFMSNRGLGDVRETPRKLAFCAHAIISKEDLLIVPNATLDDRFKNNPLVTGPPNIRFYGGAPLVCPEGYKLGTLCLIDGKPRHGMTLGEKQNLRELAALVIDTMVQRRREKMRVLQDQSSIIATTAHDLLTPLSGVQMSLSLLLDDEALQTHLTDNQKELVATAGSCSEVMSRICHSAIDTFRGADAAMLDDLPRTADASARHNGNAKQKKNPSRRKTTSLGPKKIVIQNLIQNLNMVMEPYPKKVPLLISVDPHVPKEIMSDDLKIFRSTINFLTNSCKHTETGSVHLKIYVAGKKTSTKGDIAPPKLVFECEDTGPGVPLENYQFLFRPFRSDDDVSSNGTNEESSCIRIVSDGVVHAGSCDTGLGTSGLGLYSVANLITSLGGEYGFRPRTLPDGKTEGAIFWFSIPLQLPPPQPTATAPTTDNKSKKPMAAAVADGKASQFAAAADKSKSPGTAADADAGTTPMENGSGHGRDLTQKIRALSTKRLDDAVMENVSAILESVNTDNAASAKTTPATNGDGSKLKRKAEAIPPQKSSTGSGGSNGLNQGEQRGRPRRALVIDDSIVIRKSVSRALDKLGFQVSQAANGLEGLKELQNNVFDVALCDFLMPVMDGLDCVHQYREWEETHRPWIKQYIVGISAHASAQDVEKGKKAGMNDFKSKPVTIKVLKELKDSEEILSMTKELDRTLDLDGKTKVTGNGSSTDVSMAVDGGAKDGDADRASKRARLDTTVPAVDPNNVADIRVCLIAEDSTQASSKIMSPELDRSGWKFTAVNDGEDALRLLKMRNWGAVFLDEEMPRLTGNRCVARFREWEKDNRIKRQNSVFLMSTHYVPSPSVSGMLASCSYPAGFDGALGKPILVKDLRSLLEAADNKLSSQAKSEDILSR